MALVMIITRDVADPCSWLRCLGHVGSCAQFRRLATYEQERRQARLGHRMKLICGGVQRRFADGWRDLHEVGGLGVAHL